MKKLLSLLLIGLMSFNVYAVYHKGKVDKINLYGGKWENSHRGGILFTLENMPSNARYFRIAKSDIAFNSFLSTLLSVKHAKTIPLVMMSMTRKISMHLSKRFILNKVLKLKSSLLSFFNQIKIQYSCWRVIVQNNLTVIVIRQQYPR